MHSRHAPACRGHPRFPSRQRRGWPGQARPRRRTGSDPLPPVREAPIPVRTLARDEDGAVLVEVTVMMTIMFVFLLGSIEFLFVFYQWNAAAKAVQIGARVAAVSDPVAEGLNRLSMGVVGSLAAPGDAMPFF